MANQEQYLDLLLSLLPKGQISIEKDSNLSKVLNACAAELATVDMHARKLIEESDPRTTLEIISEYETVAGLPDECDHGVTNTLQERRTRLTQKLTKLGGQSRPYYLEIAQELGYQIQIREFKPFRCGESEITDISMASDDYGTITELCTVESDIFFWEVEVDGDRTTWFRAGESQCGIDSMLQLDRATDLECILNQLKPAHTHLQFIYQET